MPYEALKKAIPEEGNRCKPNCGRCCVNDAPVSKSEANEIFAWVVKNSTYEALEEQFQYADGQPGKCPFLKPDKSCFIYQVRPFVCRYFGHGADPGMPEAIQQKCPEGVEFTQVSFNKLREAGVEGWFQETRKADILTGDFRNVTFVREDGVEGTIPRKETPCP